MAWACVGRSSHCGLTRKVGSRQVEKMSWMCRCNRTAYWRWCRGHEKRVGWPNSWTATMLCSSCEDSMSEGIVLAHSRLCLARAKPSASFLFRFLWCFHFARHSQQDIPIFLHVLHHYSAGKRTNHLPSHSSIESVLWNSLGACHFINEDCIFFFTFVFCTSLPSQWHRISRGVLISWSLIQFIENFVA